MIFHPRKSLKRPATIFPSLIRVATPKIHEVTGIIARITLTNHPIPK